MLKKVNKGIWRFYGLVVLLFGAKNIVYYATIIYLVAGENIVLILYVKTTFSQIKQKKIIILKRIT
jgi:hypothetical protein